MKRLVPALGLAAVFVWGVWFIVIPADLIERAVEDNVRAGAVSADVVGLKKGIFMSVEADRVDFRAAGENLLSVEEVSGRLDPAGFASLSLKVPFEGVLAGGTFGGTARFKRGGYEADVSLEGARLDALPVLRKIGVRGRGALEAELHVKDGLGYLKFFVGGLSLDELFFFGGNDLVRLAKSANGMIRFDGRSIEIESVSLTGDDVHARARGSVKNGRVEMQIEVMIDDDDVLDPVTAALLGKYKVSPGYYVVPIKTDAGRLGAFGVR